jgi:hypothetical protein
MEIQNRLTHYQYESEDKEAFLNVIDLMKDIEKDTFDLEKSSTLLKMQDEFVKIRGESRRNLCSEYSLRLSIAYGKLDWPDYHYISTTTSDDINDINIQNSTDSTNNSLNNMIKDVLLASTNNNFIHINNNNNNNNNIDNNNVDNNNNNNNNNTDIISNNYNFDNYNNFNNISNNFNNNIGNNSSSYTNHISVNNSINSLDNNNNIDNRSINNNNINETTHTNIKKRNHSVTLKKGGEKGAADGYRKSKLSLLNSLAKTLEYKDEFDKRRYKANLLKYTPSVVATPKVRIRSYIKILLVTCLSI